MPNWAGRWKGGRYYLDDAQRPVYFIERHVSGVRRTIRLATHDPDLALGELANFEKDPDAYCRPAPEAPSTDAVYMTTERINRYLASIRGTVEDHRNARANYLDDWSAKKLDLRTASLATLETKLAEFEGGHNGRTEALNAFARFLVRKGELARWLPLECEHSAKRTRAERVSYNFDEIRDCYEAQTDQRVRDVFHVRLLAAGMHHTEIEQLEGARIYKGPMPDRGTGIRVLPEGEHPTIRGVLQFKQKKKPRHRVSVTADVLEAALRLRADVPDREFVWEKLKAKGVIPSNLRHTFITLAGELGEWITYTGKGVPLDLIQQVVGHSIGSKVTLSNYDKLQIPPMVRLPLKLPSPPGG
jgi:hypothetical protein